MLIECDARRNFLRNIEKYSELSKNFALNLKQKKVVVGHQHNAEQGNAAGFNDREIMECFHLISLLGWELFN